MNLENAAKKVNRVPILLSDLAGMIILGLIYGWSIFRNPLQEMFASWTETMLSNAFTILMCSFAAGSVIAGNLSRKIPRQVMCVMVAVLMLVGFFGVSWINKANSDASLIYLYFFYCVICGFATGIGYNMISSNLVEWFDDYSGTALGAGLMGYGLGALVMGGLAKVLIDTYGLSVTFRIIGVVSGLLMLLISPFQRKVKTAESKTALDKREKIIGISDLSPSETIRTGSFWMLMLWSIVLSAACLIIVNSAASISEYYGAPAVLGLIISLANGIARVCNGIISDRFGFKKMSYIHHVTIILAVFFMMAGGITQNWLMITAGLVFTGFSFGFTPTSVAIYVRKKYGSGYFSANYSFFSWGLFFAALFGPSLCGIIQEHIVTDNYYLPVFCLMAAYGIIGEILGIALRKTANF